MEELNLGDLDFDTSGLQLFDDKPADEAKPNTNSGDNPVDGKDKPADSKTAEGSKDTNTNTGGEDLNDPESVANQSKENNQVQAGKTATGDEGSDSSSPKLNETEQLYSNLAAEFKAKGVLPELDVSNVKSLDDIQNAINSKVESQLTERQKFIEEAQKVGAPVNEISAKLNTIEQLKAVTPEFIKDEANVEFRRSAMIQDFMSKDYSEERAIIMAQRSIDAGTDIEDAEFALASVIKLEEADVQGLVDSAKAKEVKSLTDLKSYISTTPEVIPGVSLTDSQKDELYNQITTDVGNKDNAFMQAQKADPTGSRVKLEALFYLTKGLTDFSVFGNAAETKVSNNIENLLRGANFTQEGTVDTNVSDENSNFKLADLKDLEIE